MKVFRLTSSCTVMADSEASVAQALADHFAAVAKGQPGTIQLQSGSLAIEFVADALEAGQPQG